MGLTDTLVVGRIGVARLAAVAFSNTKVTTLFVCGIGMLTSIQCGPDFLVPDEAEVQPPCKAVIEMRVDDDLHQWAVRLPEGIASERVSLALR
jgi:hypothetical protein